MRRFMYCGYFILLWAAYLAVYFLIPTKDSLTYISLMFCTIALTTLVFMPLVYPKKRPRRWVRFKLYCVTVPYCVGVFAFSYFFMFQFRMEPDFYFLVHSLIMVAASILLIVATAQKEAPEEPEEEAVEETVPVVTEEATNNDVSEGEW